MHVAGDLTAAATAAVTAERLVKAIDDKPILRELTFTIPAGSYTTLLGANGAGKSTLLKILATLMPASGGHLHMFGHDVSRDTVRIRSRIGMIGHESMLYRDLSPMENLVLFGRLYALPDPARRAKELLESVGLSARTMDPVKTFSRGMVQRTAIARALMHDPDLLLADEPFTGLDAPSARTLASLMDALHQQGKTIVLVNHDIARSIELAEHVLVLRGGQLVINRPAAELDEQAVLAEVTGR